MEKKGYAPVVAFVYNRPDKAKKMMESLAGNKYAKDSDLFIYSDGPKNENARDGVEKTREYIDSVKETGHFLSVTIIKAEKNKGLAASVISGVGEVMDRYGRAIVVEDDLILSPGFLAYMNTCLDYYSEDKRIWSVSGYTPMLRSAKRYEKDVYLNYRASSWGWGTWKDRWDMVDWNVSDYDSFKYNPVANIRFCLGGNDQPSMLRTQMKGKLDSWAIRWCYAQSRRGMYSIAPTHTLVENSGLDGSGTNSRKGDKKKLGGCIEEEHGRSWTYDDLKPEPSLLFMFYRAYHLSIYIRIRDKIQEIMHKR